jgi:carboxyl-terminal processing protease
MSIKFSYISLLIFLNLQLNAQIEQDQIYKYNQVLENINNYYVDSVDDNKIVKSAIIATLKELDPHSVYFDKDEYDEINKGLNGSFVGIGITYDIIKDTVLIISVIENGPSEKAGVLAGDRIIKIEDDTIAGTGLNDEKLKNLLSGEKGSSVTISVKRNKQKELEVIKIVRGSIPVKSIDAAYRVNENIGYIKLNRFSSTSIREFKQAVEELALKNTDKIILDLRNNSGGYLDVSISLCEFFLKQNTTVLYTKGVKNPEKEYKTLSNGKFTQSNLVILINETTASAGEIVSGAIQDWDRGIIIGRRSFGKGLVQKPYFLVDGSVMRLTIAKYYTPSGRNIQKPYTHDIDSYRNEISVRMENGELMHKDSIKFNPLLKYYTLNNNRILYGGGGIMPDIFIELDTMKYPDIYKNNLSTGKINEFIHLYTEKERNTIRLNYTDFNTFNASFDINKAFIEKLIEYLDADKKTNASEINELINNKHVTNHLKALIAYDCWSENEFYIVFNELDESFKKAVDILNDKNIYSEILKNKIVGDYTEKK